MPNLQSELKVIEESLDYIARRLESALAAANLRDEFYNGHTKQVLEESGLQTIIEEVRVIEKSVKHIGAKQ